MRPLVVPPLPNEASGKSLDAPVSAPTYGTAEGPPPTNTAHVPFASSSDDALHQPVSRSAPQGWQKATAVILGPAKVEKPSMGDTGSARGSQSPDTESPSLNFNVNSATAAAALRSAAAVVVDTASFDAGDVHASHPSMRARMAHIQYLIGTIVSLMTAQRRDMLSLAQKVAMWDVAEDLGQLVGGIPSTALAAVSKGGTAPTLSEKRGSSAGAEATAPGNSGGDSAGGTGPPSPVLTIETFFTAVAYAVKAIMSRQAGEEEACLVWTVATVQAFAKIPRSLAANSLLAVFVLRNVALIALSYELDGARAAAATRSAGAVADGAPAASATQGAAEQRREEGAVPLTAGGEPQQAPHQHLPPLHTYPAFFMLAHTISGASSHWPFISRIYNGLLTEAAAMHAAACVASSAALGIGHSGDTHTAAFFDEMVFPGSSSTSVTTTSGSSPRSAGDDRAAENARLRASMSAAVSSVMAGAGAQSTSAGEHVQHNRVAFRYESNADETHADDAAESTYAGHATTSEYLAAPSRARTALIARAVAGGLPPPQTYYFPGDVQRAGPLGDGSALRSDPRGTSSNSKTASYGGHVASPLPLDDDEYASGGGRDSRSGQSAGAPPHSIVAQNPGSKDVMLTAQQYIMMNSQLLARDEAGAAARKRLQRQQQQQQRVAVAPPPQQRMQQLQDVKLSSRAESGSGLAQRRSASLLYLPSAVEQEELKPKDDAALRRKPVGTAGTSTVPAALGSSRGTGAIGRRSAVNHADGVADLDRDAATDLVPTLNLGAGVATQFQSPLDMLCFALRGQDSSASMSSSLIDEGKHTGDTSAARHIPQRSIALSRATAGGRSLGDADQPPPRHSQGQPKSPSWAGSKRQRATSDGGSDRRQRSSRSNAEVAHALQTSLPNGHVNDTVPHTSPNAHAPSSLLIVSGPPHSRSGRGAAIIGGAVSGRPTVLPRLPLHTFDGRYAAGGMGDGERELQLSLSPSLRIKEDGTHNAGGGPSLAIGTDSGRASGGAPSGRGSSVAWAYHDIDPAGSSGGRMSSRLPFSLQGSSSAGWPIHSGSEAFEAGIAAAEAQRRAALAAADGSATAGAPMPSAAWPPRLSSS